MRSDTIANAYSRSTHSLLTYIGVTYSVFYLVFHVMKFTFDGIMEKLYVGALLESTYQVHSYSKAMRDKSAKNLYETPEYKKERAEVKEENKVAR